MAAAPCAISWALKGAVDLIVGGHTHHLLREGDRDEGVPIGQAGCFGEHLGRIVLDVDRGADRPVRVVDMTVEDVGQDAPADPAVLAERRRAEEDLEAWLDEPVGHLDEEAPHDLTGRSHAAEVVLTALLDRFPADVGVLIAAHCTDGLPAGPVRRRDVWAATSSPGNPATGSVTGAELRTAVCLARTRSTIPHGHSASADVAAGNPRPACSSASAPAGCCARPRCQHYPDPHGHRQRRRRSGRRGCLARRCRRSPGQDHG